jgi:hypothetical protein
LLLIEPGGSDQVKLGPILLLVHEHRDRFIEVHAVLDTDAHPDDISRTVCLPAHSLLPPLIASTTTALTYTSCSF